MDGPVNRGCDQPVRVLVVDDHDLLSTSLRAAFAGDGRATVVGTAGSIAAGLLAAAALQPEVVLTDRRLPDGDMDEHIGEVRRACPAAKVVLMTGWPTERSSLAALDGGVAGIVTKLQPIGEILDAVVRVVGGDLVVPQSLTHALLARAGRSDASNRNDLSRRELDVLEALARGESTVEVGRRLCISHNTVRNHLSRAMLKLGVHSRVAAVAEATGRGLVAPRLPWVESPRPEVVACR